MAYSAGNGTNNALTGVSTPAQEVDSFREKVIRRGIAVDEQLHYSVSTSTGAMG